MSYSETLISNSPPDEAFAFAVSAARFLGWGMVESDPGSRRFRAITCGGVRSIGETINAQIVPNPIGCEIHICSGSRAQLIDWGKNKENVILFLQSIQNIQRSSRVRQPMNLSTKDDPRFCNSCGTSLQSRSRFCGKCGTAVAQPANATTPNQTALVVPSHSIAAATNYAGLSDYYRREFSLIESSGERYQGRWNWAAFIFGAFWALTKGLWVPALIAFIGSMFTGGLVGVIYWIVFAARGNYMYYRKVRRNVNPAY